MPGKKEVSSLLYKWTEQYKTFFASSSLSHGLCWYWVNVRFPNGVSLVNPNFFGLKHSTISCVPFPWWTSKSTIAIFLYWNFQWEKSWLTWSHRDIYSWCKPQQRLHYWWSRTRLLCCTTYHCRSDYKHIYILKLTWFFQKHQHDALVVWSHRIHLLPILPRLNTLPVSQHQLTVDCTPMYPLTQLCRDLEK